MLNFQLEQELYGIPLEVCLNKLLAEKNCAIMGQMEVPMALKKASLACVVCGSRNYSITLSSNPKPTRLEVNKFCKYCGQYTVHKETR